MRLNKEDEKEGCVLSSDLEIGPPHDHKNLGNTRFITSLALGTRYLKMLLPFVFTHSYSTYPAVETLADFSICIHGVKHRVTKGAEYCLSGSKKVSSRFPLMQ